MSEKAPLWSDGATKERRGVGDIITDDLVDPETGKLVRRRDRVQPPVEYYYNRGVIIAPEYYAGLQMMDLYLVSGFEPSQSNGIYRGMVPDQNFDKGRADLDVRLDASRKLHAAEKMLHEDELAVIRQVCGRWQRLETAGKNTPLRLRLSLRTGLRALSVHFKIT